MTQPYQHWNVLPHGRVSEKFALLVPRDARLLPTPDAFSFADELVRRWLWTRVAFAIWLTTEHQLAELTLSVNAGVAPELPVAD
jgi:hypothetical protein